MGTSGNSKIANTSKSARTRVVLQPSEKPPHRNTQRKQKDFVGQKKVQVRTRRDIALYYLFVNGLAAQATTPGGLPCLQKRLLEVKDIEEPLSL